MEEYKVWIDIEKHTIDSDGNEDWEEIGMPTSIGIFDSLEEAENLVSNLQMEG